MNEWIDVKDRLPQTSLECVLCLCEDGEQHVGIYCKDTDDWYAGGWESCCYCGGRSKLRFKKNNDSSDFYCKIVAHWMPLPKAPNDH